MNSIHWILHIFWKKKIDSPLNFTSSTRVSNAMSFIFKLGRYFSCFSAEQIRISWWGPSSVVLILCSPKRAIRLKIEMNLVPKLTNTNMLKIFNVQSWIQAVSSCQDMSWCYQRSTYTIEVNFKNVLFFDIAVGTYHREKSSHRVLNSSSPKWSSMAKLQLWPRTHQQSSYLLPLNTRTLPAVKANALLACIQAVAHGSHVHLIKSDCRSSHR